MARLILICYGGAAGTGARYVLGGRAPRWLGPEFMEKVCVLKYDQTGSA